MPTIGTIRLGYGDTRLFDWLRAANTANITPLQVPYPVADLPFHEVDALTLERLEMMNVRINYDYVEPDRVEDTDDDIANEGMILFSRKNNGSILSNANTCFSYMLHCRELQLGAAVHVSARYGRSPEIHMDMLNYAIANMGRLAPDMPLTGFISGGFAFTDPALSPQFPEDVNESMKAFMIENNEMVVKYIVSEMMRRGIAVDTIDIGGDYQYQELELHTGRYMASTHNIANERVKRLFNKCVKLTD